MDKYYILDGHIAKAVDVLVWAEWFKKTKDRHVADETINGTRISTAFLELNHQWGDGEPLLFETIVFGGELNGEMERYSTWEQAEAGHKKMVQRVKNIGTELAPSFRHSKNWVSEGT